MFDTVERSASGVERDSAGMKYQKQSEAFSLSRARETLEATRWAAENNGEGEAAWQRLCDDLDANYAWGAVELDTAMGLINKYRMPHLRFHDVRHLNASVMVKLRIPDLYAMERGGGKTRSRLNRVYQHTFSDERLAVDAQVDEFFNSIMHKDK